MTLQWDFYRKVTSADSLGGCIHYFDTTTQSLYLSGGEIKTKTGEVEDGHWEESVLSDEISTGGFGYSTIGFDHPHNGTLYGIATDGADTYFLQYVYSLELTDMYEVGDWREQIDNQIKSLSLSVKNISADRFALENTLFNPGAKITVKFMAGDSEPCDIGVVYLDDIEYDAYSSTIPMSARNSIGYFLSEQTFDDRNIYSGGLSTVLASILLDAGITSYNIQNSDAAISLAFDSSDTILDGLNAALAEIKWRMAELSDGRVIIGDEDFIGGYIANGHYNFNGGSEIFKRLTAKNADAAYTRVCVTNYDGLAVFRDVQYWDHWKLGKRKTKYYNAPEGYNLSDMEDYADKLATELQFVGIGETFTSPIRPHLLVGDVADIYYTGDAESTSLGVITQITHTFGQNGFFTEFTLDSGGTATDGDDYTVVSTAILNGYNRKQRVLDIVGLVANKKITKVYSGGAVVKSSMAEAASISPASLLKIL